MAEKTPTTRSQSAEAVTGVQLAQGIGHRPTRGFWSEAWAQVVRRPGAIFGLTWLGIVAFFAVFAPLIATGHPWLVRQLGPGGEVVSVSSPVLEYLGTADWLLLIGTVCGLVWLALPFGPARSLRLGAMICAALQAGLAVVFIALARGRVTGRDASDAARALEQQPWFVPTACAVISLIFAGALVYFVPLARVWGRVTVVLATALVVGLVTTMTWNQPIARFDYNSREAEASISVVEAPIPFSPQQGDTTLNLKPPGSNLLRPAIDRFLSSPLIRDQLRAAAAEAKSVPGTQTQRLAEIPADAEVIELAASEIRAQARLLPFPADVLVTELEAAARAGVVSTAEDVVAWMGAVPLDTFHLGTDSLGQDVLSQLLHACRLSISIGLVSTAIAVGIGITVGALMGYFGGWVDLLLYRLVEVFMAIPVLFLLIVAAAVLPRNTYVMMIIIGCVTWTGAARFVRAEFLKLRNQDFVQSARAVGLPLRSILFKHMLPNGVTPVLVDSSFLIAAAIIAEATLSFLGLGPANQASWGRLLSDATNQVGAFVWWLAIFPGLAIFLTVLSYNLIGEALRDAIDPKLKKARV